MGFILPSAWVVVQYIDLKDIFFGEKDGAKEIE